MQNKTIGIKNGSTIKSFEIEEIICRTCSKPC